MFQQTDFLNLSLSCFVKFTLSLVDKVTIGTCNLASVILNFAESPSLHQCPMHFSIQFDTKWVLKLINDIYNDLQKLLKYFNGTTNFVFFYRAICISNSTCCFSYKSCFIFK